MNTVLTLFDVFVIELIKIICSAISEVNLNVLGVLFALSNVDLELEILTELSIIDLLDSTLLIHIDYVLVFIKILYELDFKNRKHLCISDEIGLFYLIITILVESGGVVIELSTV